MCPPLQQGGAFGLVCWGSGPGTTPKPAIFVDFQRCKRRDFCSHFLWVDAWTQPVAGMGGAPPLVVGYNTQSGAELQCSVRYGHKGISIFHRIPPGGVPPPCNWGWAEFEQKASATLPAGLGDPPGANRRPQLWGGRTSWFGPGTNWNLRSES